MATGGGPPKGQQNVATGTQVTLTTTSSTTPYNYIMQGTAVPPQYQFNTPIFPDLNPLTPSPNAVCLAVGHTMGEDIADMEDGSFIVFCQHCGERLNLRTLPGGVSFQRIKALLTALAAGEAITEEVLGEFLELKNALCKEAEALELAAAMLSDAAEIVKAKGVLATES